MIYAKFHEDVVALCDSDLIGKEFEEGKKYLHVSERFYKGTIVTTKEVVEILQGASNLNLVGKEVVGIALKKGFITKEHIMIIQGVPHGQIYAG
ncbi:DUF424 domain-containing protein [Candidatus Woesearchaeota archaeon]|nr:DUF424 domain-containing protein [Candidatus Woesearchaeota archaeon]